MVQWHLALTHFFNKPTLKKLTGFCISQHIGGPKCPCWGKHWRPRDPVAAGTHCHLWPTVSHHPGMLNFAKPEAKPQCTGSALTLWPVFAFPANSWLPFSPHQPLSLTATMSSLHACCPFQADLCHHITVLSLLPSTGAWSTTLCCCIWFPSRDSNYFFGTQCETFLSIELFHYCGCNPLTFILRTCHSSKWVTDLMFFVQLLVS